MKNGKRFGKAIATILTALLACFLLPQASSSYVVEGTPTLQAISDTVESTEPVCYIGSTFYTSIEGALTVAGNNTSADTVYVIPGVTATISKDCTIASGDTLCLPYSATLDETTNTYSGETYTNGNTEEGSSNTSWVSEGTSGFADSTSSKVQSNRVSLVTLAENKTLTVDGNLYIGGQSGLNGTGVIDQTNGKYCEIFMENKSTINVNSGAKLVNYGYIKKRTYKYNESGTWSIVGSLDNQCTINVYGTAKLPLVIYDYKGGNQTLTMLGQDVCPFEIFDFPNLQVPVKYYAGCKLLGNIRIYASVSSITVKYETDIAVIGSSSDSPAFIVESGYVEFDYQVTSSKNPVTSYTSNTKGTNDLTAVTIAGEASLNYIYFEIDITGSSFLSLFGFGNTVDTRELSLPFSYKYDFEVTADSTMNIIYPVKFMPGCKAVVDEGGTLNVSGDGSLLLYGSDFDESSSMGTSYAYPEGLDEAKLTCNGTFNLTGSFGGTLLTESENAVFNAKDGTLSASSLDGYAITSTSTFSATTDLTTVSKTASGVIGPSDDDYASGTFGNEAYTSASVTKSEGNTDYYWKGTRYYETIYVSVTVPGVGLLEQVYSFTIKYRDKAGNEIEATTTGNKAWGGGDDKTASYAVKKGSTFTVSATRSGKQVTLTATPAGGTAQTATASSNGGDATLSLSADQDWTITMSS